MRGIRAIPPLALAVALLVMTTAMTARGWVPSVDQGSLESNPITIDIAEAGQTSPTTTIPANGAAIDTEYDRAARSAVAEGGNKVGSDGIPIPLSLPKAKAEEAVGGEYKLGAPSLGFFHTPAQFETLAAGGNYQSDHAVLYPRPLPSGAYNMDYWFWLGMPTDIDPINCNDSPDCFWFVANQLNTSGTNSGLHIGPQHGVSSAGNSHGVWKISVSGYNNGVFVGSLSSVAPPEAAWARVRVWRLSTSGSNATWGVWVLWSGSGCPNNDCYAGSITLPGHTLTYTWLFTEVMEVNGPCTTDFERVYFDNPVYRNLNGGPFIYTEATADYEDTCRDTTWESIQFDFVRDERMKGRVIPQNGVIWQII